MKIEKETKMVEVTDIYYITSDGTRYKDKRFAEQHERDLVEKPIEKRLKANAVDLDLGCEEDLDLLIFGNKWFRIENELELNVFAYRILPRLKEYKTYYPFDERSIERVTGLLPACVGWYEEPNWIREEDDPTNKLTTIHDVFTYINERIEDKQNTIKMLTSLLEEVAKVRNSVKKRR